MERYGSNTIGLAESLFYHDSVSCLQMLMHTEGDERENLRWLWGLRAIEELLSRFEYSVQKKLVLLENLKNSFATEFHVDKPVKRQLDDKYRNNRQMINEVMKLHARRPAIPIDPYFANQIPSYTCHCGGDQSFACKR
jgi:thiopeptide-type bacteriocin biosynthesis protein